MERGREARKGKANGTGDDHDRTQRGDHDAVRVGGTPTRVAVHDGINRGSSECKKVQDAQSKVRVSGKEKKKNSIMTCGD